MSHFWVPTQVNHCFRLKLEAVYWNRTITFEETTQSNKLTEIILSFRNLFAVYYVKKNGFEFSFFLVVIPGTCTFCWEGPFKSIIIKLFIHFFHVHFSYLFHYSIKMQCFTTRQVLVEAVNNHLSHLTLVQCLGQCNILSRAFYFVGTILIPRFLTGIKSRLTWFPWQVWLFLF